MTWKLGKIHLSIRITLLHLSYSNFLLILCYRLLRAPTISGVQYDKMITNWLSNVKSELKGESEQQELTRYETTYLALIQTRLLIFSVLCFLINLAFLIYGQFVLHRGLQGWVITNVITLAVFCLGSAVFCTDPKHTPHHIHLIELYFWLIYSIVSFGIIGGIIMMIDYKHQVTEICGRVSCDGPQNAIYTTYFLTVSGCMLAW